MQMPDMTGLDVVRAIGAEKMPAIIFCTAYDDYAIEAFKDIPPPWTYEAKGAGKKGAGEGGDR